MIKQITIAGVVMQPAHRGGCVNPAAKGTDQNRTQETTNWPQVCRELKWMGAWQET